MFYNIHHRYKYFHCTVQRAKDRRLKFHFCRLPFDATSSLISLLNCGVDVIVDQVKHIVLYANCFFYECTHYDVYEKQKQHLLMVNQTDYSLKGNKIHSN